MMSMIGLTLGLLIPQLKILMKKKDYFNNKMPSTAATTETKNNAHNSSETNT